MDIVVDQRQISSEEKSQINKQLKAELIDHLYQGCLPGTMTGFVVSAALFLDFYGYTPTFWIIIWLIGFNMMMATLTGLYFVYKRYQQRASLNTWEITYSIIMCGCAVSWVPVIFLLPSDTSRQYLALIAYFMATTGYATGTIGQFGLCVATLIIMLVPLMVWCFLKGGLFYNIIGVYSLIYMLFMFGINLRSTRWFKDSLKLKLENTLVSYQANHDLLTNLPNQRLLPRYIESAIASISGTTDIFALVCFSLNRMEILNDSLGNQAGNAIVQSVAMRLQTLAEQMGQDKKATKCIATISRKETFNILLTPLDPSTSEDTIRLLFSVLDEPFYLETKGVKLTASLGVSYYPKDGTEERTLVTNAEAAMQRAKQFGGNKMEVYRAEINAQSPKKLELETDLHDAIKYNQLQLYYQPLVDIRRGKIIGMEALLRWPHPVHGFISPMHFIPIAEECGLILPIGEWVIQEACIQTKAWHKMGYDHLKVAVNVSEKQMREPSLINTIKRILTVTEFNPKFLEVEITETAILDESVVPMIKEFKNMGLSLAVDDFGTGYSGLSYLKRFEVDKLKIDQSFIRDIPSNSNSMTIVSAIIAMAKELDVKILAEGVETIEQLKFLQSKGCDYVQGYYFSKPLETNFFTQLLVNYESKAIFKEAVH